MSLLPNIDTNINNDNNQPTDKIPENIGPYELGKKMATGGYSEIYSAKSRITGDDVVLKIFNKTFFQKN